MGKDSRGCEYCIYDRDDCVRSLDKRGHVSIQGVNGNRHLNIRFNGILRTVPIKYCPMCGRELE